MDIDDDEEARTQDLQVAEKKRPASRSEPELLDCEELDDAIIGPNQSLELGAADRRWQQKGVCSRVPKPTLLADPPKQLLELRLRS